MRACLTALYAFCHLIDLLLHPVLTKSWRPIVRCKHLWVGSKRVRNEKQKANILFVVTRYYVHKILIIVIMLQVRFQSLPPIYSSFSVCMIGVIAIDKQKNGMSRIESLGRVRMNVGMDAERSLQVISVLSMYGMILRMIFSEHCWFVQFLCTFSVLFDIFNSTRKISRV